MIISPQSRVSLTLMACELNGRWHVVLKQPHDNLDYCQGTNGPCRSIKGMYPGTEYTGHARMHLYVPRRSSWHTIECYPNFWGSLVAVITCP